MSSIHLEREYQCWNDCQMSGCPKHIATLDFQSTSNAWHFNDGKGQEFYPNDGMMHAMFQMVGELAPYRVEAQSLLDDASKEIEEFQQS